MKKKLLSIVLATVMLLSMLPLSAVSVSAATSGDYTYTVTNGKATITSYNGYGGDITIPSTLGGYPVTAIGDNAFARVDATPYYFDYETLTLIAYIEDGYGDFGENEYRFGTRNDKTYTTVGPCRTYYDGFYCKLYEMSDDSEPTVVTEPETDKAYKFGMIQGNVSNTTVYYLNGAMNGYYMDTTTDWDAAIDVYLESDIDGDYLFTKDADGNIQYINMVVSGTYVNGVYQPSSNLTSVTIPNSVITIGDKAFERCHSLTSVIIGNSVTTIGEEAFYNCESLTSITIPDSVITIDDYAFSDCYGLTSVTIAYSVTSIGDGAFDYCFDLTDVYYSGSEYDMEAIDIGYDNDYLLDADWHYTSTFDYRYEIEDGEVTITKYTGNGGDVTIPATIEGYPVTVIGNEVFDGRHDLYSVIIPGSVTTIGEWAFYNCESLTSVVIPHSVTSIGDGAFYCCKSLTSMIIPNSVTSIGNSVFFGCGSLTSVTIPNSVTSIGEDAFCSCRSLISVTISGSVTTIGEGAFYNCESLTSVTIPDSVITIGLSAFDYCSSLTNVYYGGSEEDKANIAIDYANYDFLNATWHYNVVNPKDSFSGTVDHSVMDTANGNGLAFRFELAAKGVVKDNKNVVDLTNATIQYWDKECKLIGMGAIVTNDDTAAKSLTLDAVNDFNVIDIPTVYLQEADEDSCAFATRIIDIPDTSLERVIYARPYYIVEVDGEQITVYGDVNSATCAEYL